MSPFQKIASLILISGTLIAAAPKERFSRHLQEVLKDPDSAKVEVTLRTKEKICGRYNAKNSYGGYVGYKPFVYVLTDDTLYAGYTIVTKNLVAYEPSELIGKNLDFDELSKRMTMVEEAMARIDKAYEGCPSA